MKSLAHSLLNYARNTALLVAALTAVAAYNLLSNLGVHFAPLALGITADDQILKSLGEIDAKLGRVADLEKKVGEQATSQEQINKMLIELKAANDAIRKQQLEIRSARIRRGGEVSDECARYIGAVYLQGALIQGKISESQVEAAQKIVADVIGKTALSSSDIPLPTQWGAEVVELVGEYGAARRYGTVFPLGASAVKLPRLGTDTTFGLIAASGTVTEKSPTVVFVTFTAEKFGGLIRLPSEIDADSIVALGQFLARYAARQIAYVEDWNFFRGTGAASGVNGTAEGFTKNVVTNSKTVALASTKTAISDATLAKFRELRTKCDAAALRKGAYYLHPSMEQMLSGFNTSGDKPYQANGLGGATLDGFPIIWVDVMPVYATSAAASTVFALFGDASYQYLGVRGGIRFDTSKEAGFTTDEILVRALERFTVGLMATGAMGGLITAAS